MVMRHCVRSTPSGGVAAVPNHDRYDDYSELRWADFSVPSMFCLPRGEDIVEGQGRWWRSRGGLEPPLHVVADLLPKDLGQRDNVTMRRFLKGLGLHVDASNVTLDHGPFAPCGSAACALNTSQLLASAEQHLRENPPPPGYAAKLQALFAALGTGVVGDWTGLACNLTLLRDGLPMPSGACQAASEFVERLLMEVGGGMEVGWGRMRPDQVTQLLGLHSWHFFNWFAPPETHRYFGASMARTVLRHLEAAEGGTRLFVGHDSDIMMLKGALGLAWEPAPFPDNATTPGSMLRIVREGDRVTATFFYVRDFSEGTGDMAAVNATFASSPSGDISFTELGSLLRTGSHAACACPSSPEAHHRAELVV